MGNKGALGKNVKKSLQRWKIGKNFDDIYHQNRWWQRFFYNEYLIPTNILSASSLCLFTHFNPGLLSGFGHYNQRFLSMKAGNRKLSGMPPTQISQEEGVKIPIAQVRLESIQQYLA